MFLAWIALLMGSVLALPSNQHELARRGGKDVTCTSGECVEYAKSMKSALSPKYSSIDPCVDFSAYACDGFRETHTVAPGNAVIDMFSMMADSNEKILRNILEGDFVKETAFPTSNRDIARDNFNKMKTVFSSCMDEEAIKKAGVAPLRTLLNEFDSLYPVKSGASGTNSSSSNEELTDVLIWLAERMTQTLINIALAPDLKNPQASIFINSVDHGMPGSYYDDAKIMANYTDTLVQMYRTVWGEVQNNITSSNASALYVEKAKKVIKLERSLTKASNRIDPDKLNTLAELDTILPQVSMTKLLNAQSPTGFKIETINGKIAYLTRLSTILKSTPREVLHAYFQTSIIRNWAPRLDQSFYQPLTSFRNVTGDDFHMPPTERWKFCLGEVQDNLEYILGSVFVERAFSPEAKKMGDGAVDSILKTLISRLDDLDWISNSTKVVAKQKLGTIITNIGYPSLNPNLIDAGDIQAFYKNMTVTTSYFNNSIVFSRQTSRNLWNSLLTGDLLDMTRMRVPAATAFYSRNDHRIVIPAGIMRIPMFSPDLPEYVSYGGLGSIIGHELTHAVDAGAQQIGADGESTRWWDNATTANYEKKAGCFVKQFSNYTFPNEKGGSDRVNGEATMEENIADTGGISASYAAWKQKEKLGAPNAKLPGFESFTTDQLFFLSYARTWCAVVDPVQLAPEQRFDVHSPRDVRILGTLGNSRGFREAFGCKVREPTCELW